MLESLLRRGRGRLSGLYIQKSLDKLHLALSFLRSPRIEN